ncbi:MAG: hypothetical protein J07HN4v3_01827 [Halonotius sp. J07HN4]|nr:MAG: hypothetical protein J07HN4v3_01827 [Halonotius sp. J07HN4]
MLGISTDLGFDPVSGNGGAIIDATKTIRYVWRVHNPDHEPDYGVVGDAVESVSEADSHGPAIRRAEPSTPGRSP